MSINEKPTIYNIKTYSVSDYLLVSRLLSDDLISWEDSKTKLLSSRATNHVSSIRKIIGEFNCIQNIVIETPTSYYEKYKLNPNFKAAFQRLKNQFEENEKFVNRLKTKLEKNKNYERLN